MSRPTSADEQRADAERLATHILRTGDAIVCPNCHAWHRVFRQLADEEVRTHGEGYLWFSCGSGRFFAGQEGTASRHVARRTE